MKKFISLLILIYCFSQIQAQRIDSTEINDNSSKTQDYIPEYVIDIDKQEKEEKDVYKECDKSPVFKDGEMAGLMKFINKNLTYPAYEKEADISGKVLIQFIVEKDGSITNSEILKKVSPGIDKEAKRLVSLTSGMWIAGKINNKPVRSYFIIPVNFSLN